MMANIKHGDSLIDFTLPATDGRSYNARQLIGEGNALVVVFTCNHCPYAQAWEGRINAVAGDFAARGVKLVAINANDVAKVPGDSFEAMAERVKDHSLVYPYLRDHSQAVARAYGAERTPEVFVFDSSATLRYHGAPDDNYEDEAAVTQPYLRQALDAILDAGSIQNSETAPVGCTIKWVA
jgi:peroxiredoxin